MNKYKSYERETLTHEDPSYNNILSALLCRAVRRCDDGGTLAMETEASLVIELRGESSHPSLLGD